MYANLAEILGISTICGSFAAEIVQGRSLDEIAEITDLK
jgi:hypothetical protein